MTDYRKEIRLTSTGMVLANVFYCKDGNLTECVGSEMFVGGVFFKNREKNLKKAHKWADSIIELAKKYEVRK